MHWPTGALPSQRGPVPQCRHCLAKWIRDEAALHDAGPGLRGPLLPYAQAAVRGLDELLRMAEVTGPAAEVLKAEVVELGAVDVRELARSDIEALAAWRGLREMERRRLLRALGGQAS